MCVKYYLIINKSANQSIQNNHIMGKSIEHTKVISSSIYISGNIRSTTLMQSEYMSFVFM